MSLRTCVRLSPSCEWTVWPVAAEPQGSSSEAVGDKREAFKEQNKLSDSVLITEHEAVLPRGETIITLNLHSIIHDK